MACHARRTWWLTLQYMRIQGNGAFPVSKKAAFFNDGSRLEDVYGRGRKARVAELVELYPHVVSLATFAEHAEQLGSLEIIFSTWGMPQLGLEQLECMPELKIVFYAAGSVQGFARPLLERGVTVVSAWHANGACVAEFTLGQILLACKGYFRNTVDCRDPGRRKAGQVYRGTGIFDETVAVIGAGAIGRQVIELLRPFHLDVLAVDPYLPDDEAALLRVRKVSLEEAFRDAYVVSNHLPNLPELREALKGEHFRSMRQGATFINTGRGAQVAEAEMIAVLKDRPDLTALLDVTFPEPPASNSALYSLPNVQLSSHIAGAMNNEVVRMADVMIEEFLGWEQGRDLRYAVTLEMLENMA